MPYVGVNPFRPLVEHRNFRIFWCGQTLSLIATWMQKVSVAWLALELSNDPFVVALISAVQALPVLLFSLYAGVIADRQDKYRIILFGQGMLLTISTALFFLVARELITVGLLLVLTAMHGIVSAFETPTRQSLLVNLGGRNSVRDSVALGSISFNLARILGPTIAAIVISTYSLSVCFGIVGSVYLVVVVGLFLMRLPQWSPPRYSTSPFEGLKEGVAFIRETPQILAILKLVGVFSLFGMPFMSLMPVIVRDVIRVGPSVYGFLLSFIGIGAVIGALCVSPLGKKFRVGRLYSAVYLAFPLCIFLFSITRSRTMAIAIMLIMGFFMILNTAVPNSLLQALSPDELRGRVVSGYIFVYLGFMPIGSVVFGAIASILSADVAIAIGGAIMLVYGVWYTRTQPEIVVDSTRARAKVGASHQQASSH